MFSILIPTLISIFALLFGLLSFWHVYQRKGQLIGIDPVTYICRNADPEDIAITVPLVLSNSGPVGIVIADLRAKITGKDLVSYLVWELERTSMDSADDDPNFKDWATPISISGNDSVKHIVEFHYAFTNPCFLTAWETYTVTIEGYTGYAKRRPDWKWKQLCQFNIFGPPDNSRKFSTMYPTADRDLPDAD